MAIATSVWGLYERSCNEQGSSRVTLRLFLLKIITIFFFSSRKVAFVQQFSRNFLSQLELLRRIYERFADVLGDWILNTWRKDCFLPIVLLLQLQKIPGVPSSYRPICLLDTTGKILEKVVYNILRTSEFTNSVFCGIFVLLGAARAYKAFLHRRTLS